MSEESLYNIIKSLNINTKSIILICGDADALGIDCNGIIIPFQKIYKYLLKYINNNCIWIHFDCCHLEKYKK